MSTLASPPTPSSLSTSATELAQEVACDHCGLPVPDGLQVAGAEQQFCCSGCASVYRMIHGCDLGRYYELRDALPADRQGPLAEPASNRYTTFDDPAFLDTHAQPLTDGLMQIDLRLSGVYCAACVWLIERLPRVCPGVIEARLSLRQTVARITWDPTQVALSQVALAIHRLGYPPHPAGEADARTARLEGERKMLIRVGVAGVCAGNTMLLAVALYMGLIDGMADEFQTFLRWVSLGLGAISLCWPGALFFRGAWAGLRTRHVTLDLPIALALGVGGIAGMFNVVLGRGEVYFDSLCVLVFLLLVGRYLQMRQQRRTTDAVTLMQSLTPVGCAVWRGGEWVELPLEAITPGDRVRVPSNERLPVDGVIVAGQSSIDTASLTGESRPTSIGIGDEVFAGSQNVGAAIEIDVQAVGTETRLARLMEDAAAGVAAKPTIVRLADRIAGVFTVCVIVLAAAVFSGWWAAVGLEPAINHAVALLIVACPCALGLATPLTLALGIGVAARRDILVKDVAVFEKLAKVLPDRPGVLALDKTGTLTRGELRVVAWVGDDDAALQADVGNAERDARHPVGRALREAYAAESVDDLVPFTHIVEDPRGGLIAEREGSTLRLGNARFLAAHNLTIDQHWIGRAAPYQQHGASLVWVAVNDHIAAFVALEDTLRDDSPAATHDLAEQGWSSAILSGDLTPAVRRVADHLHTHEQHVHAELAPEDKTQLVERYREPGQTVLMVGDGVNDAAALAAADVGLAVQGGAEAAMAVADAYTARPGLRPVVELVALSKYTVRLIRQNLWVSLGYNATAVALAAAGLLTPWIAAILMPISSLTVLSLAVSRLSRWKGSPSCP
ncbi:heavy metal translocating P-type ATPase [Algisphaera agarilytica]|uniref:Cu2+-exporting ATPase n=1 Tax=Algisphaera agarilytica TaxID=1385975 RepID=A0A7X0LLH3_9BACT|nr:heavy metal translocating P-type ATPase [Algisphaera agarilytica]MBB6431505.1 Cu2+-exporting ATPase [Algisphaera agarilytica]